MDILVGSDDINCTPFEPYSELACDLLDAWSREIKLDAEARDYPDVLTFGFYIRRGSIARKKEEFESRTGQKAGFTRIGRGLAFHIAPSNVPVNCMYTLVFGLLSGCANVVRVPTKEFPQVEILCRALNATLKKPSFDEIRDRIQVLKYDRDEALPTGENYTAFFSRICDVRVIWGGDETIADIRKNALAPRAKEITFADRYSLGIISTKAVAEASEEEIMSLASDFYNDTYLMDQNACSSPHLIGWMNDLEGAEADTLELSTVRAQERFWNAVANVAKERYDLADIKVSDKFCDLCEVAMRDVCDMQAHENETSITDVKAYAGNMLYVCDVESLSRETVEKLRGRFGTFFQYVISGVEELRPAMDDPKVQTCAVYGVDPEVVRDVVVKNGYYGVDRVVPFGHTLDIDVIWDGYDLVAEMSRIIN